MRGHLGIAACVVALGAPAWASAEEAGSGTASQEILFQLVTPSTMTVTSAKLVMDCLGEQRTVELRDDGVPAGDVPDDGVFLGRYRGPFAHFITVELAVGLDGEEPVWVYEGIVRTRDDRAETVGWRLSQRDGEVSAERTAVAHAGRGAALVEGGARITLFGWGIFVVCVVGLVVWSSRKET